MSLMEQDELSVRTRGVYDGVLRLCGWLKPVHA